MPEKRYIDANKIIEKLNMAEINPTTVFICEALKGLINDAHTEDVVSVVHCYDCMKNLAEAFEKVKRS